MTNTTENHTQPTDQPKRRLPLAARYGIIAAAFFALAGFAYLLMPKDIAIEARIPYGQEIPKELANESVTYMGAKGKNGDRLEFVTTDGERSYTAIGARVDGELPLSFFKHKTYIKSFSNEYVTLYVNE